MWKREECGREKSVGGRSVGRRRVWEGEECGREKNVGKRKVWEGEECGRREEDRRNERHAHQPHFPKRSHWIFRVPQFYDVHLCMHEVVDGWMDG